ncbi:MAG: ATP-binding cassette domain-containing protein [Methanosphaera stadtmanae]|nr:ATP-binding cassette domain-containing protein [Methanosphaera stadtmanae]
MFLIVKHSFTDNNDSNEKSIDYTITNEFQKEKRNEDIGVDNQNMKENENVDDYMTMNNNTSEKINFAKNIKHEYKLKVLNTEEEIEKEEKKSEVYDFYAIDFSSLTKYTLRFSHYDELYKDIKGEENGLYEGYYSVDDRVTIVHSIINKSIVKTLAPNNRDYSISYTLLDKNAYSELYEKIDIQSVIPFFILFFFVPCVCNLLVLLVIEKESRIKESLIIIGLNRSSFWVSWALVYSFIIIVSTVLVTVVMAICKMFINIHWSVLVVSMIIFGLSCCSISFILSTFIKKSKTANVVGVMIIMFFFAMFFLEMYVKEIPTLYTVCKFILSPISFLSLFSQLDLYDRQRIQINLFSLFKQPSLRISFLGLIFTFVCYIIIAIYLDNVLPQGNNFHRKWHFFITDLFKSNKHKSFDSSHKNISNPYIQEDPNDKEKAVEIKNIGKTFKIKGERIETLKNIDFNAYYNEIFAILGHNGAGKTTLMSIMTGILSSTNGEVYYDSIPITGNEAELCKQFGYCPQFDTFNNDLTVGEHVKLFSGIKNINVDIDSILQDIDLLNKKNNFPKELSGGQRRKLCITLALLGSPKFVFLDEPTTGLDPYSRKNIWELLSRKKEGRVIFVTTHYMDEADLLADRKMIISNGNISCLGTSLFLKQQFNMNYSLDINCKDIKDCSLLDKMIDQFCPGTSETKTISNTNMQIIDKDFNKKENENGDYLITYSLPMKYSKTFKDIFENINEMIKNNNNSIENFSLTAPTLEELFIKLENSDESNLKYLQATNTATINMNSDNEQLVEKLGPVFRKTKINKSSSLNQIYSIVKLRLKIFIRNKTFAFLYTLLPVVLSILSIYIINLVLKQMNEPKKLQPFNISTSVYENEKWFKKANITSPALDYINKIESANKLKLDTISYANDLSISSGKDISKLNYAGGFYGYEGVK